jgi:hypothetical protein
MGKVKIGVGWLLFWAEVAKPGQRRSPEAAVPKGFVGSNPTLRTSFLFLLFSVRVILGKWWPLTRILAARVSDLPLRLMRASVAGHIGFPGGVVFFRVSVFRIHLKSVGRFFQGFTVSLNVL